MIKYGEHNTAILAFKAVDYTLQHENYQNES